MISRKQIIEEIISSFRVIKRKIMAENQWSPQRQHITPTQVQILLIVMHHEGISVKEIAKILSISSSAVAQLVNGLVENGYLIRENSPDDHRFVQIKLSCEIKKHAKAMKARFLRKVSTLFDALDDNEIVQYNNLNKKILEKLSKK